MNTPSMYQDDRENISGKMSSQKGLFRHLFETMASSKLDTVSQALGPLAGFSIIKAQFPDSHKSRYRS